MPHPVEFAPQFTSTSTSGSSVEWAVAFRTASGTWHRSDAMSEADARRESEITPGALVISREVLGWAESPVYVGRPSYDGSMDALVSDLIEEDNAALRSGLERGADIAVTHMNSLANRIAHRLSCPSLETQFDRQATWSPLFRERLKEDRDFRPAIPSLFTRDEARRIARLRSCKICWPNIEESEDPPASELFAEGLKNHHIDRKLADTHGTHLGLILEVLISRSSSPTGRFVIERVAVRTDTGSYDFEPRQRVRALMAFNTPADKQREATLRQRVGITAE
jgi:hypothetical protein